MRTFFPIEMGRASEYQESRDAQCGYRVVLGREVEDERRQMERVFLARLEFQFPQR